MQLINSILFATAALTTLTEASQWHYRGAGHHHRRDNMTGSGLTTAVVYTYETHTITSCAPTVSSCPARSTILVTSTIAAYTTICPIAEASSYGLPSGAAPTASPAPASSSANMAEAATSSSSAPYWSVPYSVPYSIPGTGSPPMRTPQAAAPSAAGYSSNIVLTYTLGSGSSSTVVTTTVAMTATVVRKIILHSI
jgi:hypothetical protein